MFEVGPSSGPGTYIKIPTALSFMENHQVIALNNAVTSEAMNRFPPLGHPIRVSTGLLYAIVNTFGHAGMGDAPSYLQEGSPKEVLAYCKAQLRRGVSWDGGMRPFVSLVYRGTVMYAIAARLHSYLSQAHSCLKWAREFIELAEDEWHVQRDGKYAEMGSCFRPSLLINIMCVELEMHGMLRGENSKKLRKGGYPLIDELQLAKKVADYLAIPVPGMTGDSYHDMIMDAAFRRKPATRVYGGLAASLKPLSQTVSQDELLSLLVDTGHIESGDTRSLNGIIAEFYRLAAEAELPDADDAAIFWWGCAANMAEADASDGYTLGQLRDAIQKAEHTAGVRAYDLFGPDPNAGGSYESTARIVAKHYAGETDDSLVLPKATLVRTRSGIIELDLDGEVLCTNFSMFIEEEQKRWQKEMLNKFAAMDTSDADDEHGEAEDEGVPPLSTLCVRSLHEQDNEFARGQSDPSSIILKAMQA